MTDRTTEVIIPVPFLTFHIEDLRKDEKAPTVGTYAIHAEVKGVFARISTEFTLVNSNARTFEGELEFPLPDGGIVCGYAIDIDGVLTDAQVVEKQKARIAFEKEVKKGADPGFVEQIRGNAYRTRIYPLPANGSRRIRIDYVTPLTLGPNGDAALWIPMPHEKLSHRDVTVCVEIPGAQPPTIGGLGDKRFAQAQSIWRVESHEDDVKSEDHLMIGLPILNNSIVSIENCNDDIFFAASVKTDNTTSTKLETPAKWRIIWDASGSRSENDIAKSIDFIKALPENAQYELHVFRNTLEPVQSLKTRSELLDILNDTPCDGGTNYEPLKTIAAQKFDGITLFFSDGFDTINSTIPEFGQNAIALASSVSRDAIAMRRICGGRFIDLAIVNGSDALNLILNAPTVVSALEGKGFSDIQGIGASATGRVTVLGRLTSREANATLVLSDGQRFDLKLDKSSANQGHTIATAWAASRVNELSAAPDDHREELLAIGRRFSIVSPVSSMIVFERLDQWLEYDIEPPQTLTELHEEWLKKRKSSAQIQQDAEQEAKNWLKNLEYEWNNRIKWWETPAPKPTFPKSGVFEERESMGERVMSAARSAMNAVADFAGGLMGRAASPSGGAASSPRREPAPAMMRAPMPRAECVEERCVDVCDDCCCRETPCANGDEDCCTDGEQPQSNRANSATANVSIQAWDPNTPYLTAIKDASKIFKSPDALYKEYLRQRKNYKSCPAFFLDCAGLFFAENARELAIRIISNLSELKLDDTALLRVYAWRLREADALDESLVILRKIAKLREDEAVSWRDLALTLTRRAKKNISANDATEALELFKKAVFTPWPRRDAIWTSLVALEEFNELRVWCERQKWPDHAPVIPEIDSKFIKMMDTDLRIVMMWDTDDTDIDLHVLEPSGEEIYYGHKLSQTGGMISFDVTTGYGPEEFLHKHAPKGTYQIMSNYFASHQQKLTGATTVTVTIFTNWSRENESSQTMSLRLEKAKDKFRIGSIDVK